jgi:hypothetical protein
MLRVLFLALALVLGAGGAWAQASSMPKATLYKNPQCGCCELYAKYLRSNGFDVTVRQTNDLATIHREGGVPEQLESCHAMFVDGYAVYGHVPVEHVRRLLSERPPVKGITLPGMPVGSPGMPGPKTETFVIYALPKDGSAPTVYAKE